ncbi:hypothetical protein [Aurantimonas sp. VKM B-3413]|uniref:hypothetical protein n=1 Tax=Aurantimonas sp. VKM B-3413 TaxID=2779401 RepID=UPI001E4E962C|nr:hypothetical protein [Aurantimonas sp. VKM B-3413]MCB8835956.1 hypothetical protein [Aurantimonas sp. VKM B-3413]
MTATAPSLPLAAGDAGLDRQLLVFAQVHLVAGGTLDAAEAHARFARFCRRRGAEPMAPAPFEAALRRLAGSAEAGGGTIGGISLKEMGA